MARTVREAVESIVSPEMVDRILWGALQLARRDRVPEQAEEAREFVEGPLQLAILEVVGPEMADAVMTSLRPILEMASSHVRPTTSRNRQPTVRARPARGPTPEATTAPEAAPLPSFGTDSQPPAPVEPGTALPLVLVATMDRSGIQRVARRLVGQADVRAAGNVFEILYALEASGDRPCAVVLDCCAPAMEPLVVANMLAGLTKSPRVILWGARPRLKERLANKAPVASSWMLVAAETTDEELARVLHALF